MLTLCILAVLAVPGQVIPINASAEFTNAYGEAQTTQAQVVVVVGNPAIPNTVLVSTRPDKLLAGVRIRWIDRSFRGLAAVYEGICTNDGRILLDSGLFVSIDRIPERPKGKKRL